MADLNVQPKRRKPVWPWILLVLIIAAVIFFVSRNTDVMNNSSENNPDTLDTIHRPNPSQQ